MLTTEGCAALAAYNRGANRRLYAACAELSDDARRLDRGAFFGSIHGTLNHLMLGDRIWMGRFQGREMSSDRLDAILYDDFDALRAARETLDAEIADFMDGVDAAFLAGSIRYRNNQGRDLAEPARLLVVHFFNHQTHHRGQVHAMLTQAGAPAPVLDLPRVLEGGG